MTQEERITEIYRSVKELQTSFESFRLDTAVELALLKAESKHSAKTSGTFWGIVTSVVVGVLSQMFK